MLLHCPECKNEVSDKAETCPKCGYPLIITFKRKYTKEKRLKLPNGFGQISEIKNRNLQNPFRAMVTVDKTVDGRPICKILKPTGYFKTYNDAFSALLDYNRMQGRHFEGIRMSDLFEEWFTEEKEKVSKLRQKSIRNFWKQCENLYEIQACDLTIKDIKQSIESVESRNYRQGIKELISRLLNYAVGQEYITKNITAYIDISLDKNAPDTARYISYTDEEMETLWNNIDETTEIVLFQCYTGFRPSEMLNLKLKDVNISQGYIIGGIKTEAGENRMVPIHPRIYDIVCRNFDKSCRQRSEYLFSVRSTSGKYTKISLSAYKRNLNSILSLLNLNTTHSPHDGRKWFITMGKKFGMDEYAIKRIVGYTVKDITENVYTDQTLEWLKQEIEKIE